MSNRTYWIGFCNVCVEPGKLLFVSWMMYDKADQEGCYSSKAVGKVQWLYSPSLSSVPLLIADQKAVQHIQEKTQHHAEINKPGHLMQDTWAKPVPLLTARKVSTVFIFYCCFKTATSQGINGKKCHGICLLWIQFKSKPQRQSITNFLSVLIKSRDSQTWREVLERGIVQLKYRGRQQKVGQKSRKYNIWEIVENEWVCSV